MSFLKLSLQAAEQLKSILVEMSFKHGAIINIGLDILNSLEKIEEICDPPKNDTPA